MLLILFLHNINLIFKNIFEIKDILYDLRDNNIVYQQNVNKILHMKKHFKYYSTHI